MRKVGFIFQLQKTANVCSRNVAGPILQGQFLVTQRRAFGNVDVAIERIDRDNSGQGRGLSGTAVDQVTYRHIHAADAAGDRGPHVGPLQIEPGSLQGRRGST